MAFSYSELLILFGLLLSVILSVAIGFKIKKNLANLWLVLFFLTNAIVFTVKFLYASGEILSFPHWLKINQPVGILRPVLLYFYVLFLVKKKDGFRLKYLLHFIPFFLIVIYQFSFFMKDSRYKMSVLDRSIDNSLGVLPEGYVFFQYAYSFVYFLLIFFLLKKYISHYKSLNGAQSTLVKWIRTLLIGFFLFLIVGFSLKIFGFIENFNNHLYEFFSMMLIILCIFIMASPPFDKIQTATKNKYVKSTLTTKEIDQYFQKIHDLMIHKKIYKNNDLKIRDISRELLLPEYQVSQIVNQSSGISFRDLLNRYRIEEAKKILKSSYGKYTVEGIALEVGFTSRSSFYNAFKKITNLTPKEFLDS